MVKLHDWLETPDVCSISPAFSIAILHRMRGRVELNDKESKIFKTFTVRDNWEEAQVVSIKDPSVVYF
jgi:hypothetical protein